MIITQPSLRLSVIACSLLLAGSLHAQMDPGFIGKRYVGAGLFFETVHDVDIDTGTAFTGTANLPLTANFDLNGFASYESFDDYDISDTRLGAMLVAYKELEYFKPFVEAGVAGTWQESTFGSTTYKSHDGIYIAGLGIEAAVSRSTALFVKADFNKYFDSKNGDYWTYTAGINTWFDEKIGGYASVAFNEGETTLYSFGVICRF
ncbi:MAG: hypothetical protein QM760_01875 [Nibricoccus sp.]